MHEHDGLGSNGAPASSQAGAQASRLRSREAARTPPRQPPRRWLRSAERFSERAISRGLLVKTRCFRSRALLVSVTLRDQRFAVAMQSFGPPHAQLFGRKETPMPEKET